MTRTLCGGCRVVPVLTAETAFPITAAKARPVGPANERASAPTVRPARRRLLAIVAEMGGAATVTKVKRRIAGQAHEADTAARISGGFLVTTLESDVALPITPLL